jgi:CheY-like chemotaxis protein
MDKSHQPNGQLLLVVDDQPFFATFLREKFEELGYGVVTAPDATEALAFVKQVGPPLVVVLDLMMPKVSGHQMLLELAKDERAAGIRVVLVSAHHTVETVAANHPMVMGRAQKPVDFGGLARLVESASLDLIKNGDEARIS